MANTCTQLFKAQGVQRDEAASQKYSYDVDSEHKAMQIRPFSFTGMHYLNFQISWTSFFITFLATFAPAALLPVIREDLNLTKNELGTAGVTAVVGAVFLRIVMGVVLDVVGPRMGMALTMLLFAPAVFLMSLVKTAGGFAAVRLFIGCSLCMFVCCQYMVGSMFSVRIVGTANAIAAGWGNMGGGVTHFVMPALYENIARNTPHFEAWRWSFMLPGGMFLLFGAIVMILGRDSPHGDYRDLKKTGQIGKGGGNVYQVLKCGLLNYRTWLLFLSYGFSFGVELTVDNIIVEYLYDLFEMNHTVAGALGGMFGLMNLFSRASGGMLSDLSAAHWGMRGRLWCLWWLQTLGGVFCLAMGYLDRSEIGTLVTMVIFSIFCQQACGATFGVAPFVSRRAYGVVSGCIGAGGNVGAIAQQVIFFAGSPKSPNLTKPEGLRWMGVMTIAITALLALIHFPMWGSMFLKGSPETTEEDYYIREWTAEEVAQGLHTPSMKFAMQSRSQRGNKALAEYNKALGSNSGSNRGTDAAPAATSGVGYKSTAGAELVDVQLAKA